MLSRRAFPRSWGRSVIRYPTATKVRPVLRVRRDLSLEPIDVSLPEAVTAWSRALLRDRCDGRGLRPATAASPTLVAVDLYAKVLIVSDSVHRGEREDLAGPLISARLEADAGFTIAELPGDSRRRGVGGRELARDERRSPDSWSRRGGRGSRPAISRPRGRLAYSNARRPDSARPCASSVRWAGCRVGERAP